MAIQISFRNPSLRNTLKIVYEDAVRDEKGKPTGRYKRVPTVCFVKPNETAGVWVGGDRRVVLEEVPT